jgi:uncharacterized damage-inducible protein DinB
MKMFHSIEEFEQSWSYEFDATQKQMDQLTDASLAQSGGDGFRPLGEAAWHVVTSIPEMALRTGLKMTAVDPKTPVPATADEIKKAYAAASGELLEQVKTTWDNATLEVEDDMYGQQWKRGTTLAILIKHEIHHRGQMTVLMRQAGLRVIGFYGPSKEEWEDMKS